MKIKGQGGFSVVNIIVGVILTMAGCFMFADPSTYPGPFIVLPIGIGILIVGAITLSKVRLYKLSGKVVAKGLLTTNLVLFVLSCIILVACVSLPVIAPLF